MFGDFNSRQPGFWCHLVSPIFFKLSVSNAILQRSHLTVAPSFPSVPELIDNVEVPYLSHKGRIQSLCNTHKLPQEVPCGSLGAQIQDYLRKAGMITTTI